MSCSDGTVHGLFERRARDGGEFVAVTDGRRSLTYRELDRLAERIAVWVRAAGVAPGAAVALQMERTPELFAAMLGVLKAGAQYVPIDPEDPAERRRIVVADAGIRVCIADRPVDLPGGLVDLPGGPVDVPVGSVDVPVGEVLIADELWSRTDAGERYEPVSVEPGAPAYTIFTSGSTGRPKGVAMTHHALVNLLTWHERARPESCARRTAQVCAVSFDFSFHEIFSTLCGGGTLVLADDRMRRDPFALVEFLAETGVERLFLPVPSLTQFADAAADHVAADGLALREVITTGERLTITAAMVRLFNRTGACLHNHYGATEFQDATAHTLSGDAAAWPPVAPIGRPIDNVRVHLLDAEFNPVAAGEPGQLCIAGAGVAAGYLRRPDRTAERFVPDPFGSGTMYLTGDLARLGADGTLEHLGRIDDQVKIRGVRIEPGEIEALLTEFAEVREAAVLAHEVRGRQRLVAHVVLRGTEAGAAARLHRHLSLRLPAHMLPEAYAVLAAMPRTSSGKTDRRALVPPGAFDRLLDGALTLPGTATERLLAEVWREVLSLDEIGTDDSFFDIGGTSLHLVAIQRALSERLGGIGVVDLFRYPTIRAMARYLDGPSVSTPRARRGPRPTAPAGDIAIIGMAGRFPGADDIETFWRNLREGVESIRPLTDAELEQVTPGLREHPDYVRAAATVPDIELFDADFFGMTAKEAALVDPQQRVFLECAWEAFERAGYPPGPQVGSVGVFAGGGISTYLINNLNPHFGFPSGGPLIEADMLQFQLKLGNDRNYLPTRVSYKLDLRGPSIAVQSACSTSLVAVHLAVRSLRSGECAMALAGGVSIVVPQRGGYLFEEGMIRSADGHCRAFDAEADGTLFGNGCGVVLLKPLDTALADGDRVIAVIKGSAVNNDGADKSAFTAPSVARQTEVVADALADAGVDAAEIGYVEAHGTGTALGDPIEVAALARAFRESASAELPNGKCAMGSVKTNIGHLDEAAGIAGLIKTALALEYRTLPPSLHFQRPNPHIDFAASPFHIGARVARWPGVPGSRRAGVSSFGMGGTNCHVVLAESVRAEPDSTDAAEGLFAVSARTPEALRELCGRYIELLGGPDTPRLADLCFTAAAGRRHFEHRFAVYGRSVEDILGELRSFVAQPIEPAPARGAGRIAFVFGGQGAQYAGMGQALYAQEPIFRAALDECAELLREELPRPLPELIHDADRIHDTAIAQPALFAVEYALARLWESRGVRPDAVMGHSLGEYVAACLAGVFALPDALALVAARGRLMQALPRIGRMVSIALAESAAADLIADHADHVAIAAVNGAAATVLSGRTDALAAICAELDRRGIGHRELTVSHAFHSPLMRPMVAEFGRIAEKVEFAAPTIPVVSNLSGRLATEAIATADYWVDHVLRPVRFADGVATLAGFGVDIFLEVAPKPTLLHQISEELSHAPIMALPTLRRDREIETLLRSTRELYLGGVAMRPVGPTGTARRVPLPTYPWQRGRHWIAAPSAAAPGADPGRPLAGRPVELADSNEIRLQAAHGPGRLSWLGDHRVFQTIVMPGVAYLEAAFEASREAFGTVDVELRDFFIHRSMTFTGESDERNAQIVLRPEDIGGHALQIFSKPARGPWTLHASGRLVDAAASDVVEPLDELRSRFTTEVPVAEIYQGEREREIDLGPLFHATRRLWREGATCLAELELPEALRAEANSYVVHPVLIEACFLALTVTYPEKYGRRTYVPVGVGRVRSHSGAGAPAWCHARLAPAEEEDPETLRGTLDLFDADGRVVLAMTGVLLKRAERQTMVGRSEAAWRDWLYRTSWVPRPVSAQARPGRCLVLSDGELGRELGRIVGARVAPAATSVAEYRDLLAAETDLVVALWPAERTGAPDAVVAESVRLLHLVQALIERGTGRLCLVTRGGAAVAGRTVADPVQAALGGLARVIAQEQVDLGCTHIDLDPALEVAADAALLAAELGASSAAEQVGYVREVRHVARLTRATASAGAVPVRPDATYLITGGLGGLGLETARLLVERGARHLVLVGRSAPGPEAEAAIAELRDGGARVRVESVDIASAAAVTACLAAISAESPPLRGVLHLAGVLDDGVLAGQSAERFAKVLAAKAIGAWHLHRLTEDLDFFVLFSSVSSALGTPGQANYAAANAFLDGLASYRRGLGLPGLAIQWGSWAEKGMSARLGLEGKLERLGEGVIPVADGLGALDALLQSPPSSGSVAVLPIVWTRYLEHQSAPAPLLADFQPTSHTAAPRTRLVDAPPGKRRALLESLVRQVVTDSIGSDIGLDPNAGFFALGMDSLTAIELRNRLQTALGCRLGQMVVFDYPTIASLTEHLWDLLGAAETDAEFDATDDVARQLAKKLGI
ncbi:amino acid adenylation domain-containing protein [Nocardia panacis]|uniref:Amino acid adenylation domain-containing protein n=1 Tax=Nocardia panacis TaxID=2340916 RepID=A0A3A4KMS9_9NOCA|nr:type I polyketide synthase [Nocardia panacis]RJO70846.1 amino acid adenylation domain-containing protein [Nocardia panacis]